MVRYLMFDGWHGVTIGGKPVLYRYDLIEHAFPAHMAKDLVLPLAKFIAENVDILKSPQK